MTETVQKHAEAQNTHISRRRARITALHTHLRNEQLALIADTAEQLGFMRPTELSVEWTKGSESQLPLADEITLHCPDGDHVIDDLPDPAYQNLLALLEQDFDCDVESDTERYTVPPLEDTDLGPAADVVSLPLLLLPAHVRFLSDIADLVEADELHESQTTLNEADHTASRTLREMVKRGNLEAEH